MSGFNVYHARRVTSWVSSIQSPALVSMDVLHTAKLLRAACDEIERLTRRESWRTFDHDEPSTWPPARRMVLVQFADDRPAIAWLSPDEPSRVPAWRSDDTSAEVELNHATRFGHRIRWRHIPEDSEGGE